MKRKTVYAACGWAMGLLLMSFLPRGMSILVLPVAVVIILTMKLFLRKGLKEIVTVAVVFLMAAGYYRLYGFVTMDRVLEKCGSPVSFTGEILDAAEYSDRDCRYHVKGEIDGVAAELYVYAPSAEVQPGDRLNFTGTLKPCENSFVFPAGDYYKSKGIYVRADRISYLDVEVNDEVSLTRLISRYRDHVTRIIRDELPREDGSLLLGMLLGDKSGLTEDDKTLFYNTGIGHVMAVSGLHLVLFCSLFMYLFKAMHLGRITRFVLIEAVMLLFMLCSGMSMSVQRAAFMMTLVNLAPLLIRQADTLTSAGAAFIILTLKCPFAVRDPSLLLSVTGVISAGALAPYMTGRMSGKSIRQRLIKSVAYALCLWVGIFPVSVLCFGECSFISPIANILLTPICMAALLLGILFCLLVFLSPVFVLKTAGLLCHAVLMAVRYMGRLSFSAMSFSSGMKVIVGVLMLISVIVFIRYTGRKAFVLCSAVSGAVIAASLAAVRLIGEDDIRIALLGKKNIDVIVAEYEGRCAVCDISGNKDNVLYLREYLAACNIRSVDALVLMSKPYRIMASYDDGLALTNIERVIMPQDTVIREDMKICGCIPELSHMRGIEINGVLELDDTRIAVREGSFSFVCDSSVHDDSADIYAEYGEIFDPPLCSSVIVPGFDNKNGDGDIYTETNLLIQADSSGRYSIGGI